MDFIVFVGFRGGCNPNINFKRLILARLSPQPARKEKTMRTKMITLLSFIVDMFSLIRDYIAKNDKD